MIAVPTVYLPAEMVRGGYPGLTVLGSPAIVPAEADGGASREPPALTFDGVHDGLLIPENLLRGSSRFEIVAEFFPAAAGSREQRFFHIQDDQSDDRILMETRLTGDGFWYADSCVVFQERVVILADPVRRHPLNRWYRYTLRCNGSRVEHLIDDISDGICVETGLQSPRGGVTSIGVRATGDHHFAGAIRSISVSTAGSEAGWV